MNIRIEVVCSDTDSNEQGREVLTKDLKEGGVKLFGGEPAASLCIGQAFR